MTRPALSVEIAIGAGGGRDRFSVEASFSLETGVLVLFGASGAGKTLTLRALAGLVTPERGRIELGGELLFDRSAKVDVPIHRRKVGYVPQQSALFPFLDVEQNVAFSLPWRERRRDHPELLALFDELGIEKLRRRAPSTLSGGEKQRVALARAFASRPSLLLLDEPLAAIDMEGRRELLTVVRRAIDARATPTVLVTHDLRDAIEIGDRVTRFERVAPGLGKTGISGAPRDVLAAFLGRESATSVSRD